MRREKEIFFRGRGPQIYAPYDGPHDQKADASVSLPHLQAFPSHEREKDMTEFTIENHRKEIQAERARLNRLFPGNENLDTFSRKILIRRYQLLWEREQYPFGRPKNLLQLSHEILK